VWDIDFSAGMYFIKYEMVVGFLGYLDFPSWVVYPLAMTKVMGILLH